MGALKLDWLGRWGGRRRRRQARPILIASRDLPPIDGAGQLPLPRSPEPFSDDEMVFAHRAAERVGERAAEAREVVPIRRSMAGGIMRGADLKALLERFEQDCARHEAQFGRAMPGRPALRLVTAGMPARPESEALTPEADAALAAALETLRKLSALARR